MQSRSAGRIGRALAPLGLQPAVPSWLDAEKTRESVSRLYTLATPRPLLGEDRGKLLSSEPAVGAYARR